MPYRWHCWQNSSVLRVFKSGVFRTQALRFSTNGIPRFICLAEVENDYLALPRGCFDEVSSLLKDHSIEIELEDKRQQGPS